MKDQILKAMNWRYAVKAYDRDKRVSKEDLETILEVGRLAPSSLGHEPWKFLVIENPALREQIRGAAWNQSPVTDATYLVVIAQRTDVRANAANELIERTASISGRTPEELSGLRQMVEGNIASLDDEKLYHITRAQTFIPLGIMIETAALIGVDVSSMGGFNPAQVDEILDLKAKNLASVTLVAIGYRRADDVQATRPKVRREIEDVIEYVK